MTSSRRMHKDVVGGILMSLLGAAVTAHSTTFSIGSLSRMGPGFFPLSLGVILIAIGILIAVKGHIHNKHEHVAESKEEKHPFEWKAWLLICLSMIAFVFLAKFVGLIAATFAIVFISALGDRQNTWRGAALLALAMVVVSVVVFWWALQLQLPLFTWGFA